MKKIKYSLIIVFAIAFSITANTQIVFQQSVDKLSTGAYTLDEVSKDFSVTTKSASGFIRKRKGTNRVTIVDDQSATGSGKCLMVKYPKGKYDSKDSGAQWKTDLGGKYKELYLSYYVKFKKGFSFDKIGKLPGLAGGTGYKDRSGSTEWSGKLMWRKGGAAEFYLHQPINNTKKFPWKMNGKQAKFTTEKWHHIEIHYKVNSAGKNDGLMEAWLDGKLVSRYENFGLFTKSNDVGITIFFFSTFFGGNKVDAPKHDDYAWFDNFVVSTKRIGKTTGGDDEDKEPVKVAPKVSITSPSKNASFIYGEDVTIKASASDTDGTVKKVVFYCDGVKLGTDSKAPFTHKMEDVAAGKYTLVAKAFDNDNLSAKSSEVKIEIKKEEKEDDKDDTNSGACSFGAPTSTALASINDESYTKVHVLGTGGPNLSNIKKLRVNWTKSSKKLGRFAFNTKNGKPAYYLDLRSNLSHSFAKSKPGMTLSGTPFKGLDGDYWVTMHGDNFVMVSKTKNYSIYFSNSSKAPKCSNSSLKASALKNLEKKDNVFAIYPNPVTGDKLKINGLPKNAKSIKVVDMSGTVLLKLPIAKASQGIDVSELKRGMYLLVVTGEKGKMVKRFYKK